MTLITNVLPNEALFRRLVEIAEKYANRILVQDEVNSVTLYESLPSSVFDGKGMISPDEPYIFILAPATYDYILAAFTVLSVAGAIAPISPGLLPKEICYLLRKARARCMFVAPQYHSLGEDSAREYALSREEGDADLCIIPIEPHKTRTSTITLAIDKDVVLDSKRPGTLLFSSGSTGPPKGVVRPRSALPVTPTIASEGDTWLSFRPPHWISNALGLLSSTLTGTTIKVLRDDAGDIWSEFRSGAVGAFLAPPDVFAALMRHFQQNIDPLPKEERDLFVAGVQKIPNMVTGGDATWPTVLLFWQNLLGRPLANLYGSTETGFVTSTTSHPGDAGKAMDRCIGKALPGMDVKLSDGVEGEILVKSDDMFTCYLGDKEATEAALDRDGYFKTGDFGRKLGDEFFVDGRVSRDLLRLRGKWISVYEVEGLVISLPYVAEACAVIASYNYRRQIAILVRATGTATVTLEKIRSDIQGDIEPFKLPTILRLLRDEEQIPRTSTGKVDGRAIVRMYFNFPDELSLPRDVEFVAKTAEKSKWVRKMWEEVELTEWA